MNDDRPHDLDLAGREAKGVTPNDPWVMPLGIVSMGLVATVLLFG